MTTRSEFFGGADPYSLPAYTVREGAHHLSMSQSTLRSWIAGSTYQTSKGERTSPPLIEAAGKGPWLLSFWNLVEVSVLKSMRRSHEISMRKVRLSLDYVQKQLCADHPLVTVDFHTDGVNLFVEHYANLLNVSEADAQSLAGFMRASLNRIDRNADGLAARLMPWVQDPSSEHNLISIDPEVVFGRPVVTRTRIPTAELGSRYRGGDSKAQIAKDFGLTLNTINAALGWELGEAA